MLETTTWFTEPVPMEGSAFSLKIKRKLHEEQTPFQLLEIYETENFGNLMVIDGCVMLTSRENFFYHEMLSHPALFTHPDPKTVWIIGGGDCGTLQEVLKHPGIEHVVQIDIDEQVTRLSERYFPELCRANHDPRAELKFIDGLRWVREAAPNSVDIIIVDSTDPVGPAEGLFSETFYRDCFQCLTEHGLVVQQSESALYHLELMLAMRNAMQRAGLNNLQTHFFPQCVYPSGWWSSTIAGKTALQFQRTEAQKRPFPTRYYNEEIHTASLAQPEFFKIALQN